MSDWQGAKALRVHLAQSAGLEARRRQSEIAAGEDPSRLFIVEPDLHRNGSWIAILRLDQSLLKSFFALACDDDLATGINDSFGVLEHKIDPLLVHKTRNKRKQRPTGEREAELSPHLVCVLRSAFPVACVKGSAERRACPRIPAFVDAVQDTRQLILFRPLLEYAVKPAAEL